MDNRRATVRCAIYTRKSTDEGLDQDFNSLDAQRESAEAYIYIASQRHEGWLCIAERYDDGGFTGGNMERPALKRLFADIEAGDIDCMVVYKVDRLSRSLLDFARIMELFDKHAVSFVSVTQQFNTTSSMGRLTLNILLSFAHFEREIISERTRDKMSAARKKGKWAGGMPVLGYDLDRKGGRLLTNIIYTGNIIYKGTIYRGEHEGIVDPDLWQRVQDTLRHNGRSGGKEIRNKYGALLRGLLYCAPCGTAMVHSYTARKGKHYRYYVCLTAQQRESTSCPTKSLNAYEIETAVVDYIRGLGASPKVFSETASQVRVQTEKRLEELEVERRAHERELKRLDARLRALVGDLPSSGTDRGLVTDQMADLQDKIRSLEQRMTVIREETIAVQRQTLEDGDLERPSRPSTPSGNRLPHANRRGLSKPLSNVSPTMAVTVK